MPTRYEIRRYLVIAGIVLCSIIVDEPGLSQRPDSTFFARLAQSPSPFAPNDTHASFLRSSVPLLLQIFNLFPSLWYIPLFHLISGFAIKFLLFSMIYLLVLARFRCDVTATLSLIILTATLPFVEIRGYSILSGLQIVSSPEIIASTYFSFRQVGTAIILGAIILFLSKRYVAASFILGIGAYSHIWNALHVYMAVTTALGLRFLLNRQYFKIKFREIVSFVLPFLITIMPLLWRSFDSSEPLNTPLISISEWWRFTIKIAPDNSSLIYTVHQRFWPLYALHILALFILSSVSILWVIRYHGPALSSKRRLQALIESLKHDNWVVLTIVPWILIAMAYLIESNVQSIPERIADFFIPVQFHRQFWIPPLFFIPIFAHIIYRFLRNRVLHFPQAAWLERDPLKVALLLTVSLTLCQYILHYNRFNTQLVQYLSIQQHTFDFFEQPPDPIYYEESQWLYSDSARLSQSGADALIQAAEHEKAGNIPAAITVYQTALEQDPSNPVLYNRLGNAYAVTGNTRRATTAFKRSGELAFEKGYPVAGLPDSMRLPLTIPLEAAMDVGGWLRQHIPHTNGFFNPPYIKEWRSLSDRSCFLAEILDSIVCIYNRRQATRFLQRFKEITNGLTYEELPGLIQIGGGMSYAIKRPNYVNIGGGVAHAIIRRRYLSLDRDDFMRLHRQYPDYRYIVTETSHVLPFQTLYRNAYFIVYDILDPINHSTRQKDSSDEAGFNSLDTAVLAYSFL